MLLICSTRDTAITKKFSSDPGFQICDFSQGARDNAIGVGLIFDHDALRNLFSLLVEESIFLEMEGEAKDGEETPANARQLKPTSCAGSCFPENRSDSQ